MGQPALVEYGTGALGGHAVKRSDDGKNLRIGAELTGHLLAHFCRVLVIQRHQDQFERQVAAFVGLPNGQLDRQVGGPSVRALFSR